MSEYLPVPPPVSGPGPLARRILGFAGVPFLALLAPFIFLPVLSRLAGPETWVAIALGQSVGAFAALVAGLGYATLAPPKIAVASPERRRRIVATSLHLRVPAWLVAAIIAAIVAAALAPGSHRPEAALMAIAMSLAALAPTWYWIGVGRALPILWSEVLPRMAATLIATVILITGGSVLWYPVLLIVAMLAGPAVVYLRITGGELRRGDRGDAVDILRTHPPAVIAETAAGAYNALAVALVAGVTSLAQSARYVSGDKGYRIGQYAVSALGNALQGWVAEASGEVAEFGRRLRVAVLLHAALGLAGFLGFALIGSEFTALLFGEAVAIDETTAIGFGVAIFGVALGTACGRIGLITLGARTVFMACVLGATVVGIAGLLIGGHLWGAPGAAWALGIAEVLSGLAQAVALLLVWRGRSRRLPR